MQARTFPCTVKPHWYNIQINKNNSWCICQASRCKSGHIWWAKMSVIVQSCVNSTWCECMYAAAPCNVCVQFRGWGGARPTDCQCSHMEEGMSVCIWAQKKRGEIRRMKEWNWSGGGEGILKRNVQLVLVVTVFLKHRLCILVSVNSPADKYVDYAAFVLYTKCREWGAVEAHICLSCTITWNISAKERGMLSLSNSALPGYGTLNCLVSLWVNAWPEPSSPPM